MDFEMKETYEVDLEFMGKPEWKVELKKSMMMSMRDYHETFGFKDTADINTAVSMITRMVKDWNLTRDALVSSSPYGDQGANVVFDEGEVLPVRADVILNLQARVAEFISGTISQDWLNGASELNLAKMNNSDLTPITSLMEKALDSPQGS